MSALAKACPTPNVGAPVGVAELASLERTGPFALITVHRPCPTLWTPQEADLFCRFLSSVAAGAEVQAIVLHGAEIFREPDEGGVANARTTIEAVAHCRVPVVAAITGEAVGAGLELALACAGRVATPASRMSLPALTHGRLPTHGAVERLPRLIGMSRAADLLVFQETFTARQALDAALIDAIDENAVGGAVELARTRHSEPRHRGRQDAPLDADSIAVLFGVRRKVRRLGAGQGVPLVACEALESAARLPLRRAFVETERIAQKLARSDEAAALSHAASARRALSSWGGPARREALARRLKWPFLRETIHLLDEGAAPAQVDRVLTGYGFAEGPFAQSDRKGVQATFFSSPDGVTDTWLSYSPTLDLMLDAGREGGASPGWYRRCDDDPERRLFDPEVARLLEASATFQRLSRGTVADEAVEARCLLAAINGAAGVLETAEDGVTATIVDAVWVEHLGFPAWKGGPLHQTRRIGMEAIVADLKAALSARRNTMGAPAALLLRSLLRPAASA